METNSVVQFEFRVCCWPRRGRAFSFHTRLVGDICASPCEVQRPNTLRRPPERTGIQPSDRKVSVIVGIHKIIIQSRVALGAQTHSRHTSALIQHMHLCCFLVFFSVLELSPLSAAPFSWSDTPISTSTEHICAPFSTLCPAPPPNSCRATGQTHAAAVQTDKKSHRSLLGE